MFRLIGSKYLMTHQRSEDNNEHKAKCRALNLLCSHIYSQPATGSFVSAQPTQIPLRATRAEYFFIFNLGISTASHTIRLQPLCVIIIHITMSSSKAALALLHLTHPTQLHLNYAANTQSFILNLSDSSGGTMNWYFRRSSAHHWL